MSDYKRPVNLTKPKPVDPPTIRTVAAILVTLAYLCVFFAFLIFVRGNNSWAFVMPHERAMSMAAFALCGWMVLEVLRVRKANTMLLVILYFVFGLICASQWWILAQPWALIGDG